jgi:hypothetical protein
MLQPRRKSRFHHRQPLFVALLLLLLCASQWAVAAHSHARDLVQHKDCVLCHFQGTADSIPATALRVQSAPSLQPSIWYCKYAPVSMPGDPRSRSPPLHP